MVACATMRTVAADTVEAAAVAVMPVVTVAKAAAAPAAVRRVAMSTAADRLRHRTRRTVADGHRPARRRPNRSGRKVRVRKVGTKAGRQPD